MENVSNELRADSVADHGRDSEPERDDRRGESSVCRGKGVHTAVGGQVRERL